jgi:hypothetical protein
MDAWLLTQKADQLVGSIHVANCVRLAHGSERRKRERLHREVLKL